MNVRIKRTFGSTGSRLRRRRRFFYDENARLIDDPAHSEAEERFIIIGLGASLRV